MLHPEIMNFDSKSSEVKSIREIMKGEKEKLEGLSDKWTEVLKAGRKLPLKQETSIFRTTVMGRMLVRNYFRSLDNQISAFFEYPNQDAYENITANWKGISEQIKQTYQNYERLKYFDEEEEVREQLERKTQGSRWTEVKSDKKKRNETKQTRSEQKNTKDRHKKKPISDDYSSGIESDIDDEIQETCCLILSETNSQK